MNTTASAVIALAIAATALADHHVSPLPHFTSAESHALTGTPLEPLADFIGDWIINTTWADGSELWSRNEFRVVMNGAFVQAVTYTKDAEGNPYARYFTTYAWNETNQVIDAHGFTYDGTTSSVELHVSLDPDNPRLYAEWPAAPGDEAPLIRQHIHHPKDGTYRWQVWMITQASDEPVEMMDATWTRLDAARDGARDMTKQATTPPHAPYDINAALFAKNAADTSSFTKTATINAPRADVFDRLTTEEGMKAVYGIESRIDLAIGGPYEWYFLGDNPYGTKGGEGNQILAFDPGRMLAFSWNAPPTQPESRAKRTWVTMQFMDGDNPNTTEVTLTHHGFGTQPHWQETKAYFEAAWPRVLQALQKSFNDD